MKNMIGGPKLPGFTAGLQNIVKAHSIKDTPII